MAKLKKLRKLLIERIDVVDNPANPDARIAFFKRAPDAAEAMFAYLNGRFDRIAKVFGQDEKGGKTMETMEKKIEMIGKQILGGELENKEQVWRQIQQLLDQTMRQADERRLSARINPETGEARINTTQAPLPTREQFLMQVLATSEGRRLYELYNRLPNEQLPAVLNKKTEVISPAWDRIEKAAAQLVTEGKATTRQQAVARVIEERPQLYLEYAAERLG